jgi:plasmid stabilization system protein ParE
VEYRCADHAPWRYYIVFHSNGDAVEILRVIHTSRDIGTILEELE